MAFNDELGKRMKHNYEKVSQTRLTRRCPVIIRLDGKAFHTFTRNFKKPFDEILVTSMQETMKYLCENIQGCVFGYTQSDEISLVLVDYKKLNSEAWFDYEVQKVCSIAASMATMAFNKFFANNVGDFCTYNYESQDDSHIDYEHILSKAIERGAMFDARCFNIPNEEVTNCIYWRQIDAIRNSIQMVGQANFSNSELYEKSQGMILDMLMKKGIDWNDYPTYLKRGSCCIKVYDEHHGWEPVKENGKEIGSILCETERPHWIIDKEIPIFKGKGREYIEKLIFLED